MVRTICSSNNKVSKTYLRRVEVDEASASHTDVFIKTNYVNNDVPDLANVSNYYSNLTDKKKPIGFNNPLKAVVNKRLGVNKRGKKKTDFHKLDLSSIAYSWAFSIATDKNSNLSSDKNLSTIVASTNPKISANDSLPSTSSSLSNFSIASLISLTNDTFPISANKEKASSYSTNVKTINNLISVEPISVIVPDYEPISPPDVEPLLTVGDNYVIPSETTRQDVVCLADRDSNEFIKDVENNSKQGSNSHDLYPNIWYATVSVSNPDVQNDHNIAIQDMNVGNQNVLIRDVNVEDVNIQNDQNDQIAFIQNVNNENVNVQNYQNDQNVNVDALDERYLIGDPFLSSTIELSLAEMSEFDFDFAELFKY